MPPIQNAMNPVGRGGRTGSVPATPRPRGELRSLGSMTAPTGRCQEFQGTPGHMGSLRWVSRIPPTHFAAEGAAEHQLNGPCTVPPGDREAPHAGLPVAEARAGCVCVSCPTHRRRGRGDVPTPPEYAGNNCHDAVMADGPAAEAPGARRHTEIRRSGRSATTRAGSRCCCRREFLT